MYAAWNGWTIPMFLFLALLRLSLNYLIARSLASPSLSSVNQISDFSALTRRPSLGNHWQSEYGCWCVEFALISTFVFPWCTAFRGWRIQWSIVPEVSEPVVRTSPRVQGVQGGQSWTVIDIWVSDAFRSPLKKIWQCPRSSSWF